MTLSVKHATIAAVPDSADGKLSSNAWNDAHAITGDANTLLGFNGTGSGQAVTVGTGLAYSAGILSNTSAVAAAKTRTIPEDYGAVGDGVTNDAVALQAWLDVGGDLFLPAKQYYSASKLIVRKSIRLQGAGYNSNPLLAGYSTAPGARIVFAAGVGGMDFQEKTTVTDVATAIAAGTGGWTQDGAYYSTLRDIALIGAGTGATATGLYSRVVVYLDNVHCIQFTGKGFDISASSDAPDGNSEYGNASLSTLKSCRAISNGSHGFHIRGRDASVLKFDSCNAQLNGGWGFLDEGIYGSAFDNCQAATNTSGSFKATSTVSAATFKGCYVETGIGANCDIPHQCTVYGGGLANSAHTNNANSFPATSIDNESVYAGIFWAHKVANAPSALADVGAYYYCQPSFGFVVSGYGASADFTVTNCLGQVAGYVPHTTKDLAWQGAMSAVGTVTGSNLSGTHSGTSSGTNTGDQTITLTGNVTGSGTGSFATTIPAGTVTLAMQANMATASVVYRKTAGSGAPEVQTLATLKTDLGLTGTNSGDQTITLTGGVTGSGTGSFATTVASVPAAAMPALTGDVTTSAGAVATTLATNIVTYAKFQQVAASSLVGNATGSLANATGITLGSTLAFSGSALQTAAITGDVTASANSFATTLATNVVTYAKFQQVAASSLVGNATGSLANATGITLAGGLAFSGSTLTAAGALTPTSVVSTGAITSSSATAGNGYSTGAGGTITQITSRTTGVTLSKVCGAITLFSAAGSATYQTFTVTNTTVAATDTIVVNQKSGTDKYIVLVTTVASGSFNISFATTGGTTTEQPVFNFAVVKAVAA